MKKVQSTQHPKSLQNLENAFDDDELLVEDEDDEQQRQQRIQSLQNQDMFWKSCLFKQSNNISPSLNEIGGDGGGKQSNRSQQGNQETNNKFTLYKSYNHESNPEDFDNYFKKYNGMSAKFIFIDDDDNNNINNDDDDFNLNHGQSNKNNKGLQNNNKNKNIINGEQKNGMRINNDHNFNDDNDESSLFKNQSILTFEERIFPKIMDIKLGAMKQPQDTHSQQKYEQDDEFDTPTPYDDEDNCVSHQMKYHSLPKKINNFSPNSSSDSPNYLMNKNNSDQSQNQLNQQKKQPVISQFNNNNLNPKNNQSDNNSNQTPQNNQDTPFDDNQIPILDKQVQMNENYLKLYLEQQKYLSSQAQNSPNINPNNLQNNLQTQQPRQYQQQQQQQQYQQKLSFEQIRENSIREMQKSCSTEGYEEITSDQRIFFSSETFKEMLNKGILIDLQPKREIYDNENYLIMLKDVKWNRIYLKKYNMYLQLRIFQSKEQYMMYTESYNKIVTKFIKYMPQTVYSDQFQFIVIQKLGDFSLYDLANLILIEAKQNDKINYQKYYLQMLSNLFDSLILILFHNYYIGNINPKNVFVSKVQNKFVIKFSNLVDFSFDYTQICDKNYSYILQSKPTELEIWFSELYSCCRCMQEMMDRDKYYLLKKNIKEFIQRHKPKYSKLMNILSFFLLRNESMKNGVNFYVIQQYLLSSFEENERIIQLSDRSIKHIQYMIQTSKMHLCLRPIDLQQNKFMEQKLFFFMQQMHFHQDFEDDEMQYMIKFINRILYNNLMNKTNESDLFFLMLDTLITDASIFRRNKHLQKQSYIVYVLYLLKSQTRIQKCIPYWKYMSQTTSLVDSQNPLSLYYVGIFNLFLIDNQKALKYFAFAYTCKNFSDDIIPQDIKNNKISNNNYNKNNGVNKNYNNNFSDEENNDNKKHQQQQQQLQKSPIISCKPKNKNKNKSHTLFNSANHNREDDYILEMREAYGYLAQLKCIFTQESNIKKMYETIQEIKQSKSFYTTLEQLVKFELQVIDNLKNFIQDKIIPSQTIINNNNNANLNKSLEQQQQQYQQEGGKYFVEQISNSSQFNMNQFLNVSKSIQNTLTLTMNFKQQFQSYQNSETLLYNIYLLFLSQVQIQSIISNKITDTQKSINNYNNNNKYKPKSFNSFHNLESRSNQIEHY